MTIFAVYSAKGGVGKTASAVNLAWLSARGGARTLVWDLDAQAAASFYLRVSPRPGTGEELFEGRTALGDAVQPTAFAGLDAVAAHFSNRHLDRTLAESPAAGGKLGRMLAPLAPDYENVILDCPPGIGGLAEGVFQAADVLLVPAIPTTLSLRTLAQLMAHLKGRKGPRPVHMCFFTMVDRRKTLHRQVCGWVETNDLGFLEARIPYASDLEKMGVQPNPVFTYAPRSPSARAYEALWLEIRRKLTPDGVQVSAAEHPHRAPVRTGE